MIARRLEEAGCFGSPDHWLQYFILNTPHGHSPNHQGSSAICRGMLKLALCPSGHLEIKTSKSLPWFTIDGVESWDDDLDFNSSNRNFLTDEIGNIEALLHKRLLVPKSKIIWEDSHCNRHQYEEEPCDERTRAEVDIIMSLPRTMLFYNGQRSGTAYNSSSSIDFQSTINIPKATLSLEYELIGKVFSSTMAGTHFTAKVIRDFSNTKAVYSYDDLEKNGKAMWISATPSTLSKKEDLTVIAAYSLVSEEAYLKNLEDQAGNYSFINMIFSIYLITYLYLN